MPNEVAVIDPLGQTVYLLPEILFSENEAEEIYDDATAVVRKPALMAEIHENNTTQFYYFRSVGPDKTLLIITRQHNNRWEAYNCIKNPSRETLSELLKRGKQLI